MRTGTFSGRVKPVCASDWVKASCCRAETAAGSACGAGGSAGGPGDLPGQHSPTPGPDFRGDGGAA